MQFYIIGIIFAITAGIANFMGQILQKKAINDVKIGDEVSMKIVVKKPLWITGLLFIIILTTVFGGLAQNFIGPALIPGLFSSGFIVLAIGSVKILNEKLKKEEWFAMFMLICGIVLVSLSGLSIEPDINRFHDAPFVTRIIVSSLILLLLWFLFFYGGRKLKKLKAAVMALGCGMPFSLGNIWMFSMVISIGQIFNGEINSFNMTIFAVSVFILGITQILGLVHFSKTLAAGNASIVVPIQQIPQQIMPVIIYFVIFALPSPFPASYFFISGGVLLIVSAGFFLGKRHSSMENS